MDAIISTADLVGVSRRAGLVGVGGGVLCLSKRGEETASSSGGITLCGVARMLGFGSLTGDDLRCSEPDVSTGSRHSDTSSVFSSSPSLLPCLFSGLACNAASAVEADATMDLP